MNKQALAQKLLKLANELEAARVKELGSNLLEALFSCNHVHVTPELSVLLDRLLEKAPSAEAIDHAIGLCLIDFVEREVMLYLEDEADEEEKTADDDDDDDIDIVDEEDSAVNRHKHMEKAFEAFYKSDRSEAHIKTILHELYCLELDSGSLEDYIGAILELADPEQHRDLHEITRDMQTVVDRLSMWDTNEAVQHVLESLLKL